MINLGLNGGLVDRLKHPNKEKYPNQFIFQVLYEEYVYSVPFVEENNKIFLKRFIQIEKLQNTT